MSVNFLTRPNGVGARWRSSTERPTLPLLPLRTQLRKRRATSCYQYRQNVERSLATWQQSRTSLKGNTCEFAPCSCWSRIQSSRTSLRRQNRSSFHQLLQWVMADYAQTFVYYTAPAIPGNAVIMASLWRAHFMLNNYYVMIDPSPDPPACDCKERRYFVPSCR